MVTPPPPSQAHAVMPDLDLDFDLDFGSTPAAPLTTAHGAQTAHTNFVDTFIPDPAPTSTPTPIHTPAPTPAAKLAVPQSFAASSPNSGMLEFDLSSLSLDLGTPNAATLADDAPGMESGVSFDSADNPLETKFSLAEEFRSLGDADGARSLAEEVVAESQGPLKAKAQAFLNALA